MYADQAATISDKSGIPNGYNMGALLLPLKAGGMSSYNPETLQLVRQSADAKMGRNLQGSAVLTLVKDNAQADQIVSLVASGSLSLVKSEAGLTAGIEAEASGSIDFSSSAILGGIIPVTASSSIAVSPSVALSAKAFMEAEAGGATPLSPEGLSIELLDNQDIETGFSLRESMRLMLATLAGELSGAPGTTITIRNVGDTKDRIVATVDSNGNRSALTYDVSDG